MVSPPDYDAALRSRFCFLLSAAKFTGQLQASASCTRLGPCISSCAPPTTKLPHGIPGQLDELHQICLQNSLSIAGISGSNQQRENDNRRAYAWIECGLTLASGSEGIAAAERVFVTARTAKRITAGTFERIRRLTSSSERIGCFTSSAKWIGAWLGPGSGSEGIA